MKSITIVSTTFQLINAAEYITTHGIDDSHLIVYSTEEARQESIKKMLEYDCYRSIFHQISFLTILSHKGRVRRPLSKILSRIRLWNILRSEKYDLTIVGNYTNAIHRYVMWKTYEGNNAVRNVVVDDGSLVLSYPEYRAKELHLNKTDIQYDDPIQRRLYENEIRNYIPEKVTFFTIYDNLVFDERDCASKNYFKYFKTNLNSFSLEHDYSAVDTIVIGSPMVDFNLMTTEEYAKVLATIKEKFSHGRPLLYYAHPVEKASSSFNDDNRGDFIFHKNTLPFEVVAMTLPAGANVVGVISTCLTTIPKLRSDLNVFSIQSNAGNVRLNEVLSNTTTQLV